KKFLKDMFVVEYEEDVPAETEEPEQKKPGANPKVASFEQSANKRPAPVETERDGKKKGPELQEGNERKMSEGMRNRRRRKSAAGGKRQKDVGRHPESEKKEISCRAPGEKQGHNQEREGDETDDGRSEQYESLSFRTKGFFRNTGYCR